ncbi:MAG: translation initiation factor [archaeon]
MSEICTTCGLPKELCVCESIAKEAQQITVSLVKKKFGKFNTLIEGIDVKQIDIKNVVRRLKAKFACGGTSKKGNIELQGNHIHKLKETLIELGFAEESITVK